MAGVPKKPQTSNDELARMFWRVEANAAEVLMQQMLGRLGQQTSVGGKRVAIQKLPRLPKQAATTVHRVKVSLHGARPPVWRRIEIPSAMRLDLVHEVMQVAFDWDGYHLHAFGSGPRRDRLGESLLHLATDLQVLTADRARSCSALA